VSPVRYELGFHIPEGGILHSHSRESLKSHKISSFKSNLFVVTQTECRSIRN
jgi:hypothetical protein